MTQTKETYAFQAEINQLMSLIINTFYSNKEIFLRELISNSSDALDKIRYESLTNKDCLNSEPNLRIRIEADKQNKLLKITDTGIGMTKSDLINNLGTIARSGTKEFMSMLTSNVQNNSGDMNLIGQFGVGFYSAFLVADHIDVYSKNNNDDYYKWSSDAGGTFTITQLNENDKECSFKRGTCLVLHLKDEQSEYLEESRIKDVLKKHSQFIGYDIELLVEKKVDKPSDDKEESDEPKVEEVKEESEVENKKTAVKKEKITVHEFEVQNKDKPIWLREPENITESEYISFYKSLTNDWEDPVSKIHFKVEGQLEYRSVLFVPKRPPMDIFDANKKKNNIKLYVKKVFIMDDCQELCPEWLSFMKGVVDSDDLPLNVSREMLQQNRILSQMKKHITKKSIELFEELVEKPELYKHFYEAYNKNIKLGIHEDTANRQKLTNLLRYTTSTNEFVSLNEYCSRAKVNNVFYLSGENMELLKASPFLEACKTKGYEVIYMNDPIDEYVMQQLRDYTYKDGDNETKFKFVNLTKEGFNIEETDDEKQRHQENEKEFELLCKEMKNVLGDKVTKVMVSKRLCDTPCILVTSEFGWSAYMEQIMKNQVMRDNSMASYMKGKKILEINPSHKIIRALKNRASNVEKTFKDLVMLMYDSSLLTSGFALDNPKNFVDRINNMISLGLSLDDEQDSNSNGNESNIQSQNIQGSSMELVD
jgi:molecular chaperone HtpG